MKEMIESLFNDVFVLKKDYTMKTGLQMERKTIDY